MKEIELTIPLVIKSVWGHEAAKALEAPTTADGGSGDAG